MSQRTSCGSPHSHATAGFTLLELLIAMTVMALLGLVLFAGFRFGVQAWRTAEERSDASGEILAVQNLLRRLLAEAYPLYLVAPPPNPGRIDFTGLPDRLSFLAPLPESLGPGGFGRFNLFLVEVDGERRLMVNWRLDLGPNSKPVPPVEERILLRGVAAAQFGYFGRPQPERPPVWQAGWENRQAPPELVQIRLAFPANDRRFWPTLVVAPRVDRDATCVYDPVGRSCRGR